MTFTLEEQLILNNNITISEKAEVIKNLQFNIQVATNEDVIDMLTILIAKIDSITNEEWNNIYNSLPFDIALDDDIDEMDDWFYSHGENFNNWCMIKNLLFFQHPTQSPQTPLSPPKRGFFVLLDITIALQLMCVLKSILCVSTTIYIFSSVH